jgi:cyclopropane fatty-acyl-phospholipid synthase-like methyltransferase
MFDRLLHHAAAAKLQNIECVLAPPDDPRLPAGQIDTILIVNTYHHFEYRPAYLARLRDALSAEGRIVIIDFVPKSAEQRGFGPPLEMQLSVEVVDAELASAGFFPAVRHTFLPEQYFVEYRLKK